MKRTTRAAPCLAPARPVRPIERLGIPGKEIHKQRIRKERALARVSELEEALADVLGWESDAVADDPTGFDTTLRNARAALAAKE